MLSTFSKNNRAIRAQSVVPVWSSPAAEPVMLGRFSTAAIGVRALLVFAAGSGVEACGDTLLRQQFPVCKLTVRAHPDVRTRRTRPRRASEWRSSASELGTHRCGASCKP